MLFRNILVDCFQHFNNLALQLKGGCMRFKVEYKYIILKGGLRPKAHILDDPLDNPYDVLKVVLRPPYGP